MTYLGIPKGDLTTHSFRCGGAVNLYNLGADLDLVKHKGHQTDTNSTCLKELTVPIHVNKVIVQARSWQEIREERRLIQTENRTGKGQL